MTRGLLASLPRPAAGLILGASGGIGAALMAEAAAAGLEISATARGVVEGMHQVDILDEPSVAAFGAELADRATPLRLVIVATGLLHDATQQPEKSMRALDPAQLARSFAVNAIGPALVAKHVLPLLPRTGKSVFAVLSARVGSISDNRLGGWHGYRASKAALNQIMRALSVEVRRTRPDAILVALHPGTVETALSAPFRGQVAPERLFSPAESAGHLLNVIDDLTADDSGGFFAWDGTPIPF